jgi:DNA-binding response OmpR family regulator
VGAARKPRRPGLKGTTVLVVEDDFLIYLGLELMLTNAGVASIAHSATLEDARAFLAGRSPATRSSIVAILDIRLDGETSLPLARELRRQTIPFLFYSGQADWTKIREEFPEAPLLAKPVSPEVLVHAAAGLRKKTRAGVKNHAAGTLRSRRRE